LNQLTGERPDGEELALGIVGEDGGLQMSPDGPDIWNEATKKKKKKKMVKRPVRRATKRNKNLPPQLRSSRPPLAAYQRHTVSAVNDATLDGKEWWPQLVGNGGEAVRSGQLVFADASELPSTEFATVGDYNAAIDAAPSTKGSSRHIACTILDVSGGLHIVQAGGRQPLSTFLCEANHDAATADMTEEFFCGLKASLAELKPSVRTITGKGRKLQQYFFGNRASVNQSVPTAGQGPVPKIRGKKFTWDYSHAGPIASLVAATRGFRHARHRALHAASVVWGGYCKLLQPPFVNEIATENYIAATHVSRGNVACT
jgi:hypothetical protein